MTDLTDLKLAEPVFVSRPTMPPLDDYRRLLEGVWDSRWLTNRGDLHNELERRLSSYLDVENLSLFCNGTMALLLTLRTFDVTGGKVITTPFTFPATAHAISWAGAEPVFCDIDPSTLNLDPRRLSELIDEETAAVLPVHLFGTPCDVETIGRIAAARGLPVIYDAAHAFGVTHQGRSLATYGDASVLSFHATKIFSTAEGGAVWTRSDSVNARLERLKDFGIGGYEKVVALGLNGKMSELHAAYGILQLETIDGEIEARRRLAKRYRVGLAETPGIELLQPLPDCESNYAYQPILVRAERYGLDRDELQVALEGLNVFTRKYFYPLCSHYPHYRSLQSSSPDNLPVAEAVAQQVLCLPIYGTLASESVDKICAAIQLLRRSGEPPSERVVAPSAGR